MKWGGLKIKRDRAIKTLHYLITGIELLMIPALAGLEFLSGYRAGIMHHLYYQKVIYLGGIYNPRYIWVHLGLVLACSAIVLFAGRRRAARSVAGSQYPGPVVYALVCVMLAGTYLIPWFSRLNIYAHLIICLECCLVLELIRALSGLFLSGSFLSGHLLSEDLGDVPKDAQDPRTIPSP